MRTTLKDIEGRLKYFNSMIEKNNLKIRLERRYNYHALDLYDLKGKYKRTVVTGMTKGEAYSFINAMLNGIELFTWKKR